MLISEREKKKKKGEKRLRRRGVRDGGNVKKREKIKRSCFI